MPIFRALGLGILIIILQVLLPEVFAGFIRLSLMFFDAAEQMLAAGIYAM